PVGWRSGVHWIRACFAPSTLRAIALASTVLAVPGTSSKSTWPLHASAARTSLISSCLPRMTDSRFARKREATSMAASVEPLIPPEYTRGYPRGIAIRDATLLDGDSLCAQLL